METSLKAGSEKKHALFLSLDLSALKIEASAKQSKKVDKTNKEYLFHARSGNGPLRQIE